MALPSLGVQDSITPYERMVRECKSLGITPLTEEQFVEEDHRMYRDLKRRRNGLPDARNPYKADYGPWVSDNYTDNNRATMVGQKAIFGSY